jgi:hypothetical protein
MAKPTAQDRLTQFLTERAQTRPACKTCNLPDELREAVNEAIRKGTPGSHIALFLQSEGHTINPSSVRGHGKYHVKK